ncbi:MAG: PD40 domain-containing protein [Bacteroidales bacterium]|nr:PD40 domain-containing protein [Bacteroidales bacterium]
MKRCRGILIIFFFFSSIEAQDWARINQLSFDADYFFMTRQYDKAIKSYEQILKQLPDNANIKYKLGVCYLNTDTEKDKAIQYFNEAATNISKDYNPNSLDEEGAPLETYFMLGSAYRVTNQLDKAAKAYRDYMDNLGPKDIRQKQVADHYIRSCEVAKEMMSTPVNITKTNLGNLINDESPNFNAVISADGNTMVYTTTKGDLNNIMATTKVNGTWAKPKAITRQVTTKDNFKTSSLSADGTILYLVEDDPVNSEIYVSTFIKGRWSAAEKLKKPINSKMNETHASLSPDGKTLYFTSDRPDGEGELDIYYSTLDEKGNWGKPVNLGPIINTSFNEETPFVSPDGNRLYFSSEGHKGMGGHDLFLFDLHENGAMPENLGYPVNTTDNDLFFLPGNGKYEGYMARIEAGGYGGKDIGFIEKPTTVTLTGNIVPDNHPSIIDPNLFFVSLMDLSGYNTLTPAAPLNEQGSYSFILNPGRYMLTVTAPGYETFSKEITVDPEPSSAMILQDAPLKYIPPAPEVAETTTEPEDASLINTENMVNEDIQPALSLISEKPEEINMVMDVDEKEPENPAPKMSTPIQEEQPAEAIKVAHEEPATAPVFANIDDGLKPFVDEVVDELNDISAIPPGTPVTYTVQLFALRKPVDLSYFRNLDGISVHLAPDNLYKYTWGTAHNLEEAKKLKEQAKSKGYRDVIIRRRAIVPSYTIQVMAGKDPVDFSLFKKLESLKVTLNKDGYYRYSYGEFKNEYETGEHLTRLKGLGYKQAFLKKI